MFLRIRPGIAPLFLLLACGTGNAPGGTSPGGAPSAGDGSQSGSGGVTTAGGGASGGAATGGSAGNTGGTNGAANDCTGPFGSPTLVLEIPGTSLGSLVLGPGELELFYSSGPADAPGPQGFFRSVRADRQSAFLPGESLPELDAGCRDSTLGRTADLSRDGLTFYFVCTDSIVGSSSELRVARRATIEAPFVLDEMTYGQVLSSPTVSPDELTLLTSPHAVSGVGPISYSRSDPRERFGTGMELTELPGLGTPDLSQDGRYLFAAANETTALVVSERSSATGGFGAPQIIWSKPAAEGVLGSPAISEDCRSLYYVDATISGGTYDFKAMMLTR